MSRSRLSAFLAPLATLAALAQSIVARRHAAAQPAIDRAAAVFQDRSVTAAEYHAGEVALFSTLRLHAALVSVRKTFTDLLRRAPAEPRASKSAAGDSTQNPNNKPPHPLDFRPILDDARSFTGPAIDPAKLPPHLGDLLRALRSAEDRLRARLGFWLDRPDALDLDASLASALDLLQYFASLRKTLWHVAHDPAALAAVSGPACPSGPHNALFPDPFLADPLGAFKTILAPISLGPRNPLYIPPDKLFPSAEKLLGLPPQPSPEKINALSDAIDATMQWIANAKPLRPRTSRLAGANSAPDAASQNRIAHRTEACTAAAAAANHGFGFTTASPTSHNQTEPRPRLIPVCPAIPLKRLPTPADLLARTDRTLGAVSPTHPPRRTPTPPSPPPVPARSAPPSPYRRTLPVWTDRRRLVPSPSIYPEHPPAAPKASPLHNTDPTEAERPPPLHPCTQNPPRPRPIDSVRDRLLLYLCFFLGHVTTLIDAMAARVHA